MADLMRLFRRDIEHDEPDYGDEQQLVESLTVRAEPTLVEHNLQNVQAVINKLIGQEMALEQLIAERSERLRQTKLSIAAFNAAAKILEADGEAPLYDGDQP